MPAALLLAAHDSRETGAEASLELVVAGLRRRFPDRIVVRGFLEQRRPTLAEAVETAVLAGAREVTVVPFFLHRGRAVVRDLPEAVRAARARWPAVRVRLAEPLDAPEWLEELVARRVAAAEARPEEEG